MNVLKVIIQEIEKRQGYREAFLTPSEKLLPIEERTRQLIEQLNKSFRLESKIIRTEFADLDRHYFKVDFDNLVSNNEHQEFLKFSLSTINLLRNKLQNSPFATGGYYVFAHYQKSEKNYLGIFIVRDTNKLLFKRNRDDTGFVIDETTIVDTEKLAMACRIDLDRYSQDEMRYLQFTNYTRQDISDYFIEWIEANIAEKSRDDSLSLLNILDDVELPIDPETNSVFEEDKFRDKVYNFIDSTGNYVRIKELGSSFWGDEEFLLNYIDQHDIEINNEFKGVGTILKTLKNYDLKSGNIRLSFKLSDLKRRTVKLEVLHLTVR